jgi:hypothetical protein
MAPQTKSEASTARERIAPGDWVNRRRSSSEGVLGRLQGSLHDQGDQKRLGAALQGLRELLQDSSDARQEPLRKIYQA